MSDKNSNRVSLFIAVVAIVLILGGVYLLNKSFSSSTKTAVASNVKPQVKSYTSNTAPSTTAKTESSDASVTAKPTVSDTSKDTKAAPSTSTSTTTTGVSTPTTIISSANSNTAGTTPNTVNATPKTEQIKNVAEVSKPLTENEIVAKFVGEGTGGLPKFEIQECGNKDSKLCVSPNKFIINNASRFDVKLAEGKKYKFEAKYNEDQSFIIFESIQSITEVK
jgi:cytoskeletal protein RodZ